MTKLFSLLSPSALEFSHLLRSGGRRWRFFSLLAVALVFMWLSFRGSEWLFSKFLQVETLAELLIERTLSLLLVFFSALLTFSSVLTAFSSFFISDDLALLMVAPVEPGKLYLSRLAHTWSQSAWMMVAFALPFLAGVGPVLQVSWWWYLLMVALFVPLTIFCTVLGSFVTMAFSRVLPARRMREVFLLLSIVGGALLYVAIRFSEPEKLLNPEGFETVVALIKELKSPSVPVHPPAWLLAALIESRAGNFGTALGYASLLCVSSAILVVLGRAFAILTWRKSYSLSQEGQVRKNEILENHEQNREVQICPERVLASSKDPAQSIVRAIMVRDLKIFFRSPGQWSQLLMVCALFVVYVFNFKYFRTLQTTGLLTKNGILIVNLVLGTLVATTLAARFLYPTISLEGRAFWQLQAAPITMKSLMNAKIHFGFWPLALGGVGINVAGNLMIHMLWPTVLLSGVLTLMCVYALSGMAVGMGALDARFDDPNPAKIATSFGAVLFMLLGWFVVALISFLSWPLMRVLTNWILSENELLSLELSRWRIVAFLLGVAVTVVSHHLPLWLGARSLQKER